MYLQNIPKVKLKKNNMCKGNLKYANVFKNLKIFSQRYTHVLEKIPKSLCLFHLMSKTHPLTKIRFLSSLSQKPDEKFIFFIVIDLSQKWKGWYR